MGNLYWITGLSGAGKTTVATELYKILKQEKHNVVFLDGDKLREIFGVKAAYSPEERLNLALQYSRLCKFLTEQNIDVVCSTISMFSECHQWNETNIPHYREIYLKVSMDILKQRDSKKIYSRAMNGEITQVMGIDIPFEEPKSPDLIVNNDGTEQPAVVAQNIYEYFSQR